MASRSSRHFEKRLDSLGRAIWYQLRLVRGEWKPCRIARPKSLRRLDKILDLTADFPTKWSYQGKGKFRKLKINRKTAAYWAKNRVKVSQVGTPPDIARKRQIALIRRGVNPDKIRVFYEDEDGGMKRYTVSSFADFWQQDTYEEPRNRMKDAGRFVLGTTDRLGDIGRVDTVLFE